MGKTEDHGFPATRLGKNAQKIVASPIFLASVACREAIRQYRRDSCATEV
jgi:hypothetical protein